MIGLDRSSTVDDAPKLVSGAVQTLNWDWRWSTGLSRRRYRSDSSGSSCSISLLRLVRGEI